MMTACSSAEDSGNSPVSSSPQATVENPSSASGSSTPAVDYLGQLPDKIQQAKKIVIGTAGSIPACIYLDNATNSYQGIDVDILEEAFGRIGIEAEWQQVTFDGLIPGVQSGRFDIAAGCITDKVEREQLVTFVDYERGSTAIIVREDNPAGVTEDPMSLCGKILAVNTGTIYIPFAQSMSKACVDAGKPAININELPSQPDAVTAMQSGRADAELQNLSGAQYLARLNNLKIKFFLNEQYMPSGIIGAVTRPDDTATQNVLLAVLNTMWADGTIDKIMAKWEVSSEKLEEPGLNLQGAAEANAESATSSGTSSR